MDDVCITPVSIIKRCFFRGLVLVDSVISCRGNLWGHPSCRSGWQGLNTFFGRSCAPRANKIKKGRLLPYCFGASPGGLDVSKRQRQPAYFLLPKIAYTVIWRFLGSFSPVCFLMMIYTSERSEAGWCNYAGFLHNPFAGISISAMQFFQCV